MSFKKKSDDLENNILEFGGNNDSLGKFVFVLDIEDVDNELKIILSGSVEGEKGSNIDNELDETTMELLRESIPVYPNEDDVYEIIFPNYIIYQVRNESYCSWDEYETGKGKWLIIFENSRLLDYFQSVTDCCQLKDGNFYPGKWKHFGICSENHIIDIITHENPIINKICSE